MASTAMIRVSAETRDLFARMADEDHKTIGEMVDAAAKKLYRDRFWRNVYDGYAKLRADPVAWQEYQDEVRVWEATLMDGLEEYPYDYGDEDE